MSCYFAEFWRRRVLVGPRGRGYGDWEPLNLLIPTHPVLELAWRNHSEGEEAWHHAGEPPEPYFEYRLGTFTEVDGELLQHVDSRCRLRKPEPVALDDVELVVDTRDAYADRWEVVITGRRAPFLVDAIGEQGKHRRVGLARLTETSFEAWLVNASHDELREALRCGYGYKRR